MHLLLWLHTFSTAVACNEIVEFISSRSEEAFLWNALASSFKVATPEV